MITPSYYFRLDWHDRIFTKNKQINIIVFPIQNRLSKKFKNSHHIVKSKKQSLSSSFQFIHSFASNFFYVHQSLNTYCIFDTSNLVFTSSSSESKIEITGSLFTFSSNHLMSSSTVLFFGDEGL